MKLKFIKSIIMIIIFNESFVPKIALSINFDCATRERIYTNKTLSWSFLENENCEIITLFLENNNLETKIPEYVFRSYKNLNGTLTIRHNNISQIDRYAFYFETAQNSIYDQYKTLLIKKLDLTHNNFTSIPWMSIQTLKRLKSLDLSFNFIKRFDIGDMSNHTNQTIFLQDIYCRSNKIEYIDHIILSYLIQLISLDLSFNFIKIINYSITNVLSINNKNHYNKNATKLNLKGNEIDCDCKLVWFQVYLIEYDKNSTETCLDDNEKILITKLKLNISGCLPELKKFLNIVEYSQLLALLKSKYNTDTDSNQSNSNLFQVISAVILLIFSLISIVIIYLFGFKRIKSKNTKTVLKKIKSYSFTQTIFNSNNSNYSILNANDELVNKNSWILNIDRIRSIDSSIDSSISFTYSNSINSFENEIMDYNEPNLNDSFIE